MYSYFNCIIRCHNVIVKFPTAESSLDYRYILRISEVVITIIVVNCIELVSRKGWFRRFDIIAEFHVVESSMNN